MRTNKKCGVQGCDGKHAAKGMCGRHYANWYQMYKDIPMTTQMYVQWQSARRVVLEALAAIDEKFLGKEEG